MGVGSRRLPGLVLRAAGALLVGLVLVLGAAAGCRPEVGDTGAREGEPAPHAWRAPPSEEGGDRCADCHPHVVESYSRTGMARALGPVHPDEFQGIGAVQEDAGGYRYAFDVDGGGSPRIVETHAASPAYRFEAELAFAVGAGELDRSFVAVRGAFLWFAPLEIVSSHGPRHAALAPGHAMSPGTRFTTAITPECLGCHTDSPPPRAFPLNLRPSPEAWEPRGISCGACHGAVDEHVAWRETELLGGEPDGGDPVLRPASMTRVQRLSICAACHLQGDARIVLDADQLGPPPPGGDLLEQRAVFVAAEPSQDVGFVSQVERLVLSRCFLESASMTCETCHDPHRSLHEPEERARVRAACRGCHAVSPGDPVHEAPGCSRGGDRAEALDCAACHVRRTGVFDVAEVEIHDHFIRRDPGEPSARVPLRFPEDPDGNWRRFAWPGMPPPDHFDDPGLWMMAWDHGGHAGRATPLLDRQPGSASAALPMYHHVRGSLLERAERLDDAVESYRRALHLDPDLGPSATNLGLLLGRTGHPAEGMRVLDEALARHPAHVGALRNRAVLHYQNGDPGAFVRDLEAAFDLLPDAELAETLASYHQQAGDPAAARRWREAAGRLDPTAEAQGSSEIR